MKKTGLTAGELLITMTIIGIIAVLVIPGFINSYHKKLYSAQIRKVYSLISTSIERACEDSDVSYFNQTRYFSSNQNFLEKYFNTVSTSNYFASAYETIGTASGDAMTVPSAKVKLKSGEVIGMSCADEICTFFVDLNSQEKPNTSGRDLFQIVINATTNQLEKQGDACTTSKMATGCFEKLMDSNWDMKY